MTVKKMKKLCLCLLALAVLALCACSGSYVDTLENWSFQQNSEKGDYSLFFRLTDKEGTPMAAEVDVDIRIVTENEETVYEGTHSITEEDFDYYGRQDEEPTLMADVHIPAEALKPGTSTDGTVYFTVYKEGAVEFDECDTPAVYCLPVQEITIRSELPQELVLKDYSGKVTSRIRLDAVTEKQVADMLPGSRQLEVSGEKTFGTGNDLYDNIGYKVYDSQNYMVETGSILLQELKAGDKFRYDTIYLYDLKPGETYTIRFFPKEW